MKLQDPIRADLTAHGSIGFQPYFLREQGYAGRNLVRTFADACERRKIGICAVVSQADDMNAPYQDRFAILREQARTLHPLGYTITKRGDNLLRVEKRTSPENSPRKLTYLLNAQSVVMREEDEKLSLTVIGTNQAPNGLSHHETMKWCRDHPEFIYLAEHPFKEGSPRGVGRDRFLEHKEVYDGIDFDPQLAIPDWMTYLPAVGKALKGYRRELNECARELTWESNVPLVPGSNAHRFEDIGIAHIEVSEAALNYTRDATLVASLKTALRAGTFNAYYAYESLPAWFSWTRKFKRGLQRKSDE
ncbi:MAG: hypothetical protein AABX53_03700 [Nanoarchaeota archaeon]